MWTQGDSMSIEVKCGKKLRDFVLQNVQSSKRVTVISPWISVETAKNTRRPSFKGCRGKLDYYERSSSLSR